MRLQSSEDESSVSSDEKGDAVQLENGYRLVDLKSFSSVLSSLHKCEGGEKNATHTFSFIFISFIFICFPAPCPPRKLK